MFINNKLNFQVRNDITFNLKNIDLIATEISKDELITNRNVIIHTIYRPPDVLPNLFNDTLNDLLQMLNQENKTMFVTGDFNINTSDAIINPNIKDRMRSKCKKNVNLLFLAKTNRKYTI